MKNKNLISRRRGTIIFTLFLVALLVVSGCVKKETPKPVVNNNTNTTQVNEDANANANSNQSADFGVNENQGVVEGGENEGKVDTSDWLTYRNEEYDFEFKYPNDWTYNDQQGEPDPKLLRWVYFFRQNPKDSKGFDRIEIKVYTSDDQEYLIDDFIKKENFTRKKDAAKDNNGFVEEYGVVNINKKDFTKFIINYYDDFVEGYYRTSFNNKEYSINYIIYNYPKETKMIFEKMFSEFKFLE